MPKKINAQNINWRRTVWQLLEPPMETTALARWMSGILMGLIVISAAAIVLESEPRLYARFGGIFFALELFCVSVFAVEYALRLWAAPERSPRLPRWRYALTPMALVDALAVLPFFLSFFEVNLAFLRLLRLMRIFKFTFYWRTSTMLMAVLRQSLPNFAVALFMMLVVMLLAACGLYLVEREVQPEAFGTIPTAMWWAIVSLTTVGYGDVVPMTGLGKALSALVIVAGIGFVSLPTSILVVSFSDFAERRRIFDRQIKAMRQTHQLTSDDLAQLQTLHEHLHLPREELREVLQDFSRNLVSEVCPHCGKPTIQHRKPRKTKTKTKKRR